MITEKMTYEGIWMVKVVPGCTSKQEITRVMDLPNVYDFASIMRVQDDLANYLVAEDRDSRTIGVYKSAHDRAHNILQFLADKSGVTKHHPPSGERKIELTL